MSFLSSYKNLEKLCGELMNDDRRISAYIEEMQNTPSAASFIPCWNDDLKQLKHYRWIRNKIVHEPDCTEENMTTPQDAIWLDNFYNRILKQTDPLALYTKTVQSYQKQPVVTQTHTYTASPSRTHYQQPYHRQRRNPFIVFYYLFLIIIVLILLLLFFTNILGAL